MIRHNFFLTVILLLLVIGCGNNEPHPTDMNTARDMNRDQPHDASDVLDMKDMKDMSDLGDMSEMSDLSDMKDMKDEEMSAPPATWSVFVYMLSDNNLEKDGVADIYEMRTISSNQHLRFLVQIDRADAYYELGLGALGNFTGTKRLEIADGKITELQDLGEVNMSEEQSLHDFIVWGVNTARADHNVLVLWDHGMAWRGYGTDYASNEDTLTIEEMSDAIERAKQDTGLSGFDMIGFDACLMGDLVTAAAMAPHTRYMVASQDVEPAHGWNYSAFEAVAANSRITVPELGSSILNAFEQQADHEGTDHTITLSVLDLQKLGPVQLAVEQLAQKLKTVQGEDLNTLAKTRDQVQAFGRSSVPEHDYQMIDISHFARLIGQDLPAFGAETLAVQNSIDALVLERVKGPLTRRSTGLAIYFPEQPELFETNFDAITSITDWRDTIKTYHTQAKGSPEPDFDPACTSCLVGPSTAKTSCVDGAFESQAVVTSDPKLSVARTYAYIGYRSLSGEEEVISRIDATLDPTTNRVTTDWDQRMLVIRQGTRARPIFSKNTIVEPTDPYVYHEVPLLYSPPAACPCALLGQPGYADTDSDGIPNCLDDDMDGDGVIDKGPNMGAHDNCPWVPNPKQEDSDNDGKGNECQTNSNAPSLTCSYDPSAPYAVPTPAMLVGVTNRISGKTESVNFYLYSRFGISQFVPKPGSLLIPMVLRQVQDDWQWRPGQPLPIYPDKPVELIYTSLSSLLSFDAQGFPIFDELVARTLASLLGLKDFFIELRVENASGAAASIHWTGTPEDLGGCPIPSPNWCMPGQQPDCQGQCQDVVRLGDNTCDDGVLGADFNCEVFAFDQGACTPPPCPNPGAIRDCDGRCIARAIQLGDGVCQDGSRAGVPNLACLRMGADNGDCPCGDRCSGQGQCVNDQCDCDAGWTGDFCEKPTSCGDNQCTGAETCQNCAADCGACPDLCGDNICAAGLGEDCSTCAADCGACLCGDGVCSQDANEDCSTCPGDCGECPACGDEVCSVFTADAPFSQGQSESCVTCTGDCGQCLGACCEVNDSPGCVDETITACVCALDSSCCGPDGWTASCVQLAQNNCQASCCQPSCAPDSCGGDGCGGICGPCTNGQVCQSSVCVNPEQCDDTLDNDGDNLADCLDPDCATDPICELAGEQTCGDGFDNDGDGAIDCLDTQCDQVGLCEFGVELTCNDGLDNDGDMLIDCLDAQCDQKSGCEFGAELTCDDNIDNDGDGLIDCLDPQCNQKAGCEFGAELTCNDGVDNDGDTFVDCLDSQCDQVGTCEFGVELTCDDGIDNDTNTFADCLDIQCDQKSGCEFGTELTCDDGIDNDGDGLVDCLDPQCNQKAGCEFGAELTCNDGIDNDANTFADCLDIQCDQKASCEFGTELTCNDGVDNDGDTFTDCLDAQCDQVGTCEFGVELTCDDGIDNDANTFADCLDIQCDQKASCEFGTELSCGDGIDNDGDGLTDCADTTDCPAFGQNNCGPEPAIGCTDQFDNDGDGLVDCADPDCHNPQEPICEPVEASCLDGIDNDGDTLFDCADPNCQATEPVCEPVEATCDDIVDNDGDGLRDCEDPDCQAIEPRCEVGQELSCTDYFDNDSDLRTDCQDTDCQAIEPRCEAFTEVSCTDGFDNDSDTLIDCADDDCGQAQICELGGEVTCDDLFDNDGDGLPDCMDPDCAQTQNCP